MICFSAGGTAGARALYDRSYVCAEPFLQAFFQFGCRSGGFIRLGLHQLCDFLDQIDRPHDQPHLGVLILLAAVVGNPHEAIEAELLLVLVGDQHIVGAPRDAAREVSDLDRCLAVDFALDVPKELLRLVVRVGRVEHIQLVGTGQELQLDGGRVNERVGPRELKWVHALLERDRAGLAHERQILAIVDRQLDAIPLRHRREIYVAG